MGTYGDDGPLFSEGDSFGAEPSFEVVDIRDGEETDSALAGGGAKVGQVFGLGSRVGCGDDNGATVAGATAVDIVVETKTPERPPGSLEITKQPPARQKYGPLCPRCISQIWLPLNGGRMETGADDIQVGWYSTRSGGTRERKDTTRTKKWMDWLL